MSHRPIRSFAVTAAFALTVSLGSSCGQPRPVQQVQSCPDGPDAIRDRRLDRAIGTLTRRVPQLRFQPDDEPCLHLKTSIRVLARTVRKDYLTGLSGYEFVKIVHGEGYLQVERFRSSAPRDLEQLRDALLARAPRSLVTEASTRYSVFVSSGDLILMVSSATGYEANAKLMDEIRRVY